MYYIYNMALVLNNILGKGNFDNIVKKKKTKKKKLKKTKKTKKTKKKTNYQKGKKTNRILKGGKKICISGGPESIIILQKQNKKIILIGEQHLAKIRIKGEKDKKYHDLIKKSIDKNCKHFSALLEELIKRNDHRNFDLFIEESPENYMGTRVLEGSGGIRILNDFQKKKLPNLRIHWADMRSSFKDSENSKSVTIDNKQLKKLYNISDNNLYWKVITMYKTNKGLGPLGWLDVRVSIYESYIENQKNAEMKAALEEIGSAAEIEAIKQVKKYKVKAEKKKRENEKKWNSMINPKPPSKKNPVETPPKLNLQTLKEFTRMIIENDKKIIQDFKEVLLYLFYKTTNEKIRKQWTHRALVESKEDPYNIEEIFLINTWENYIRRFLVESYGDFMNKIMNDELTDLDSKTLFNYLELVNTIIFAVILDFYILGRITKDYIHDDIIIYTGSAHTANLNSILTQYYGYEEIYKNSTPIDSPRGILDLDDTELFMLF